MLQCRRGRGPGSPALLLPAAEGMLCLLWTWGEGRTPVGLGSPPAVTPWHRSWLRFAARHGAARSPQALQCPESAVSPGLRHRGCPYGPAAPTAPLLLGRLQAHGAGGGSAQGQGLLWAPLPGRHPLPILTPGLVRLQLALSGLVGIVSWKRPLTLVVGVSGGDPSADGGPGWGGQNGGTERSHAPETCSHVRRLPAPQPCPAGSPSPPRCRSPSSPCCQCWASC